MTDNVLKFKKSRWELLGKVGVDGGMIIITDAENFPKYFDLPHTYDMLQNPEEPEHIRKIRDQHYPEMKEIDLEKHAQANGFINLMTHDVCLKIANYSGYSIPWLGGDGDFPLYGRFVTSNEKDILSDILVYQEQSYFFSSINDFEKKKECSIDIYSGKIGIDEPSEWDKRGLVIPSYSYDCYLGNGNYNIFELNIKFNAPSDIENVDSEIIENSDLLGTLIELNPEEQITKQDLEDLLFKS